MPHSPETPADLLAALRLHVQDAVARALLPAALGSVLLAVLAVLLGRLEQRAHGPWHPHPAAYDPQSESTELGAASKTERRLRAWIGWILRCLPGLGMSRSGAAP